MSPLTVIWVAIIILKLANVGIVASWSWWLILLPVWITVVILVVLGVRIYIDNRYIMRVRSQIKRRCGK